MAKSPFERSGTAGALRTKRTGAPAHAPARRYDQDVTEAPAVMEDAVVVTVATAEVKPKKRSKKAKSSGE